MANKKIKIILADDHEVYLDGLSVLLNNEPDFVVVDIAKDGEELVDKVLSNPPDVAVVDLDLPKLSGIKAIKEITGNSPTRCIAHTFHSHIFMIQDALDAGAIGFVVKNAPRGEITNAIRTVANDMIYCCRIAEAVLAKSLAMGRYNPAKKLNTFSAKEIRIAFMIAQEKTSDQIGVELFLSKRSIEGIRRRIISKMRVKSPAGVVLYALKNHLFSLDDLDAGKL